MFKENQFRFSFIAFYASETDFDFAIFRALFHAQTFLQIDGNFYTFLDYKGRQRSERFREKITVALSQSKVEKADFFR